MTDYDDVARSGTYSRRYAEGRYARTERAILAFVGDATRVLELGCGSGHWLSALAGRSVVGLDASTGMLADAQSRARGAHLVRARAEALPFAAHAFDRVLIVNALHHFSEPAGVLVAVHQVLRTRGAVMIVGLDPSMGGDRWPVYDWFEGTRARDEARFASSAQLRAWLSRAGFATCSTHAVETFVESRPAREAVASGALARHTTSQLSDASDAEYAAGLARIERAADDAAARGEVLTLHTRLTLYATVARLD